MAGNPSMWKTMGVGLLVGLILSGCGFKLRTWELDANVQSAAVVDNTRVGGFARDLERALTQAGVEIVPAGSVDDAGAPEITVKLLESVNDRRSVSVTDRARAAEYELQLGVNYSVLGADRQELIEPRWVRVQRIYRINRGNLVGSNEEESLLRKEMRADVVQQILRAVNQVTTSQS